MSPEEEPNNVYNQAISKCPPGTIPPTLCGEDSDSDGRCVSCPVWKELSENEAYRAKAGVEIQTMGGQAANLFFRFDSDINQARVWRQDGHPEFAFGEADCHAICRRYQKGLKDGVLPPSTELGGTSYFNAPKWPNAVLDRHPTPYAAAVIRYALPPSFNVKDV